ncbi:MAG TPA: glycosyltransferase family A protein [Solirubrobacteraceae bacterium]|jgi:GT2 family glycosyltransferase|nr:glycosyltransferase family A protein [Solirubrobacteraceae bacterium]
MKEQEWRAAQHELRRAVSPGAARRQPPAAQPLASVIVVCWNAADVLGRCLEHLFAQDYANREIIVVDDGSTDTTLQVAEQASRRGELTVVQSARNRGCPAARNLGLRHARGEIVAFVDADGFATPHWLSRVMEAFGEDPTIGGVASTVLFDDNPMVVNGAGGIVNRQGWAADLCMNESLEVAQIGSEALYPMGCGMALRREALVSVGPFDDRVLNYYDDVDYGVRLWRAGYKVAIASDAWIDHGSDASGGDSARKRLWCERHRMRVVLRHSPAAALVTWATCEARELKEASMQLRVQKLRSIAWNAQHLPSALVSRWRLRHAPCVPDRLVDPSWGNGFPAGVPLRLGPTPECACAAVEMDDPAAEGQLLHGWFPAERVSERSYRWAGLRAAVLVHLDEPVGRMHLDYAHVPVDIGAIDVHIRRVGSAEPLTPVWATRLPWQYISRSVENHPLRLEPGDYEVVFAAARGWSDPPRDTRSLSFALSSLSFAKSFDVAPGGLEMGSPTIEEQLVNGWFEAEESPARRYRWATGRAGAVVRLAESARSINFSYCLPPRSIGTLRVALTRLDEPGESWSTRLRWRDADWHEEAFSLELAPGDYLVSFATEGTWSNRDGRDPELWGESRSLGFALSSLSFSSR